jgi:uncharacterized protein (UPF0333 family)
MRPFSKKNKNKGQVLVEYMLLLLISVSFATLLVSKLVSRKEGDSQGLIIKAWSKMLTTLGNDLPDCPNQTNFNSAKCN